MADNRFRPREPHNAENSDEDNLTDGVEGNDQPSLLDDEQLSEREPPPGLEEDLGELSASDEEAANLQGQPDPDESPLNIPMVEFNVPEGRMFAVKFNSGPREGDVRRVSQRQLDNADTVEQILGNQKNERFTLGHADAAARGRNIAPTFEPNEDLMARERVEDTVPPGPEVNLEDNPFDFPDTEETDFTSREEPTEDLPQVENISENQETSTQTKREHQSRILRNGFTVALITGGIIIAFFDSITLIEPGADSEIKWWTTTLAASVMIIYFLWGRRFTGHPTARELFADSFYYLGFLFTFIALASGIIQMEGENMNVQRIVGQLGVALITTILGMGARVILVQFSPIVSEPEQDLMHRLGKLANEMSDLADNFNSHLNDSIEQLTKFRGQLVAELEDTQRTLTENLQNTFDEVHSKSFERVTDSLNDFQTAMQGVGQELSQFSSDLNKLDVDAIGGAAPQLAEKMVQLTTNLASIQSSLDPIFKSLSTSSKDLESLAGSARQIQEAQKEFEIISTKTRQLNTTLEQAHETTRASDATVKRQLDRLDNTLDEAIQSVEGVDKDIGRLSKTIQQHAVDIVEFLRTFKKRNRE